MAPVRALRGIWRELLRWARLISSAHAWLTRRIRRALYRDSGTPPDGGSRKLSASTSTKERGTQRQATATGADFNSSWRPGALSVASLDPTLPARVNSYTVPGVFTDETATPGGNGEQRGRVV